MSYNINSNTIVTPSGTIAPYLSNVTTDPSGWVICDGASRSNATGQYNNLINAGLINANSFSVNSSTGTGVSTSYLPATYTFNQMATSQNGQLILAGHNTSGYLYLSTNRGNTWTRQNNSLVTNWLTVAMSATTGQYQLAGSNSFLYLSTNTGSNWLPISGSQYGSTYGLLTTTGNWSSSAISNAGQYMLAGMNTGNLYMSTSSGNSWRLLGGAANTNGMPTSAVNWSSCSMNASGSLMSVSVNSGSIYLSTNSGTNWSIASSLSTSSPWSEVSIASSANYVVAAANSGNIFLSTDGAGATWTAVSGTGTTLGLPTTTQAWQSLAISGDGTDIIAGTSASIIYASTTGGNTWTTLGGSSNVLGLPNAATSNWSSMAISQDGSTWLADVNGAQLYISTDGQGKLWGIKSASSVLGTGTWNALSMSSDGTTVLAGNASSNLFVSYDSGNTYNALSSNGNLSGTKNWSEAAISSNNQIMTACATGDFPYLSSNAGLTWSNQLSTAIYTTIGQSWSAVQPTTYTGVGQNWALIAASTGLVTSASFYNASMSSTGQFVLAGIYGGVTYFSTDYGTNWTATPTGLSASANYTGSSISSTGQYMLVSTSTGTNYFSNTYGTSFTITSATGATGCASSVDGKYLLSANWLSSNYGANWAVIASSTGITTTNVNFWQPAISATGQYMILTSKQSAAGSPVNISTSYGSFWTQNPVSGMSTSAAATGSAISASGQFMVVLVLGGSVYLSSTYGANWVQTPGIGLAASENYYSAIMSSSGQYILIGGNAGTANSAALSYFSSNYGANWLSAIGTPTQSYGISVAMSSDGRYMLNAGYGNAGVYMSTATFSTALGTNALSRYGPTLTFQQIPTITNFSKTSVTNTGTNLPAYMGSPTFGMDGTGQYMLIADSSTSTNKGAFVTSNYGTSWTQLGTTQGLPATVTNAALVQVAGNGYMVMMRLNGGTYNNIYLSINYGKNWTSVYSSIPITPQIITMSANGQVIMYSSWNSNVTIYITTNAGSTWGTLSKVACGFSASGTGQYLCLAQYNGGGSSNVQFYISSNYGVSFTTVQTNASVCYTTAISYSGEYMLVTDLYTQVWVSSNFGVTFKNTQWGGGVQWCAVSYTGQYMTCSAEYISTNYGVNWTANAVSRSLSRQSLTYYAEYFAGISGGTLKISSSTISSYANSSTVNSPTIITNFYRSSYGTTWVTNPGTGLPGSSFSNAIVVMSGTGQYILYGDSSSGTARGVFLSSNFGNNWTQLGTAHGFPATVTYTNNLYVASGGQYMAFPYAPTGYLWISSNSGAYWYNSNRSVGSQLAMITISGNGKYMMYNAGTGNGNYEITLSSDFGKTWAGITKNGFGISMSYTGQYMCIGQNVYPSPSAEIFVSKDFGVTFSSIVTTGSVYYITTTSGNGEYMMASDSGGGNSHLSSNFGVSFTLISALSGKNSNCCFMSYTGQYIITSSSYLSTNYGINWTSIPLLTQNRFVFTTYYGEYIAGSSNTLQLSVPTSVLASSTSILVVPNPYWYSVTTDSTGQYVAVGSIMNQGIWCSTDFATTWQGTNQGIGTVQQLANSGTNMIAAINNLQGIYYSNNNGGVWQVAATQTSNNYISVAMSSSASYGLAGSIGGGVVYSSSNGQSWALSNITTGTYGAVAMSSTGQYGVASNSTTIYYSTNFGQTFILSGQTTVNAQSLAISQTGQYAVAGTTTGIYYSNNYGQTWSQATGSASTGTWYGINIMSSGQYVVAGNAGQGLWYSLNFGQTWTQSTTNTTDTWYQISTTPTGSYLYAVSQSTTIYQQTNVTETISANGLPTSTSSWQTVSMDSTGQYQLLGVNNGFLYFSNTFGNSWSTISGQSPMTQLYNNGNGLPTVALAWNTTKFNSTGQYALAGINNGALYMSTNFATNWVPISGLGVGGASVQNVATNYGFTTNSLAWQTTSMNSTGQYMLAGSNNNFLYLSTNSGTYWAIIGGSAYGSTFGQGLPTTTGAWYASAVSSTGQYMATGLYGGAFYFSKNYGQAWTAYTNSPLSSAVNWYSMSMASSGTSIVASSNGSNIYNITTMIIPTATYTPPQISGTSSTDGTGLKYIIKL